MKARIIISLIAVMISAVGYGQTNPTSTPNGIRIANGVESIPPPNYKIPYIDPVTKVLKDYVDFDSILPQNSKIPNWEEKQYNVGDVVFHNKAIWRNEIQGNEIEPGTDTEQRFEIIEEQFYYIGSGSTTTEIIPAGSYVGKSCSINTGVTTVTKIDSDIPIGTSCSTPLILSGPKYRFISYYDGPETSPVTCEDLLAFPGVSNEHYIIRVYGPDTIAIVGGWGYVGDNITYKVKGCPLPDLPIVVPEGSTSSWTMLSQINEDGFMKLTGTNTIDDTWVIETEGGEYGFMLQPHRENFIRGLKAGNDGIGSIVLGFDGLSMSYHPGIGFNSQQSQLKPTGVSGSLTTGAGWSLEMQQDMEGWTTESSSLLFPNTGLGSKVIAVSVNGEVADESGNIEINIETPDLESVLSQGNEATNSINLNHPNPVVGKTIYGPLSVLRNNPSEQTVGTIFHIDQEDSGVKVVSNDENGQAIGQGLFSDYYYGENYQDNTYVQKKYVDDSIPRFAEESFLYSQPGEVFNLSEEPREIVSVEVNRVPIYLNNDYSYSGVEVDIDNYPLFTGDKIIIKYNY